ncbi:tetratricopeptide repeat protein [Fusobacterium simiae]|uniref:Tetratricopeptide repeat protein n=1 Tax=Fusobacterium simiae TaxID=855 RepID=A0ABT4DH79_FUSSI|nr:tetratricopeptide repeat protein [Fusobacterium simiae]MCY7007960.1 tetratricopeptide repeat protein [Fusobacterium simiae]
MKKILIIIFIIVIFIIVGGIFGYKKILSNEKENKIIQLFNKDFLGNFSKNKKEIIEKLKTLNREEADELYEQYLENNNIIVENLNKEHKNLLLNDIYNNEDSSKNFTDKEWEVANKFLNKYDLELWYIGRGHVSIREVSDFYYKIFKDYVTDDYREYLKITAKENEEVYESESGLAITLEELGDRIVTWENFLEKYPNSKLNDKVNNICNSYRRDYVLGVPGGVYDYKESADEYNRFVKKYPNSPTTELLEYYLENVNLNNPRDNDSEALSKMIDKYIEKYFYLGYLENRKKGNFFSYESNELFEKFNMDKKEIIQLLKNLNKEEANKIYEEYLESNFKILEKIEENDYEVLDNVFYVGEGNLDKGKLDKQNKFLDNYGLEIVENEIGLMITEKKDFYYNIFKNYVSDDYRDFLKLRSEDVDYIDYVSSFDKYSEIIADKIVAWENFLEKYPDSKLEKKANDICQSYRVDYITSLIFPSTTEALINGRSNRAVEELNRFIKKYPNSPTTKIIKFYLENYKNEDINDILADKIEEIYSKGE